MYILPVFLVTALFLPSAVQAQTLSGKVSAVGDGDTLRLSTTGGTKTIRLACIDAPEMAQKPHGETSRRRLQELLPVGQQVSVRVADTDRYKRLVGKVYKDDLSINLVMVQEGQAVVYPQYLGACPELREQLQQAESDAKAKSLGFWATAPLGTEPTMPWEFRAKPKQSRAQVKSSRSGCDASYPNICIPVYPPDLDCGEVAYRRFEVTGSDPHGFDRDGDGVGCER